MTGPEDVGALPIVQYWHSDEVPGDVAELLDTFHDLNPDLRHLVFSEAEAEKFIAEHFTSREVAAFRACAVPAMQADYFRYCAVLILGGVYADADFRCRRPLQTLIDATDGAMLFRREPRGNVANGFFLFKVLNHPLLRLTLDVATLNIERRAASRVNEATGPWIFSGLSALHRLGSLDAFRQMAADQDMTRLAESFLDAAGDHTRVAKAFEGVRIASMNVAMDWIGVPAVNPRYKEGEGHWANWNREGRTIFR